jgi:hypothetical protein
MQDFSSVLTSLNKKTRLRAGMKKAAQGGPVKCVSLG